MGARLMPKSNAFKTPFIPPFKLEPNGRNRWFYRDVVDWLDERAGRPPRKYNETDAARVIGTAEVRELLGGVSEMYLWRLLHKQAALADQKIGEATI
jgi:hypothetical protein